MVTEIKYAESTGSVQFENGKEIEMKYSVKVTLLNFYHDIIRNQSLIFNNRYTF